MSRDPGLYLEDIADRAGRVTRLAAGRTFEEFQRDDAFHEAILRHLTIIGEAVKGLPTSMLDEEPGIPWRQIARLRDLLVHVYFAVNDEIIWQIVSEDIEPLRTTAERMLVGLDANNTP